MDFEEIKKIEEKWQKEWENKKVFEAKIKNKKKFFITFPIPYVNGAPHVGHAYSAFRTDCYARFKRLQGFNVLFAQSFHATGEPIVGVQKRLLENDEIQIKTLKEFGARDEDIEKFKKDARNIALYWANKWIEILKKAGFSIDWRRTFIVGLTENYIKFTQWQFKKLKEKGYVKIGTHPVVWCPSCLSPTGDHDRLKGEGAFPVEMNLIKFKFEDKYIVAATLRPETIYGITNIWINKNSKYVEAKVDNEIWIISKEAAEKLKDQNKKVEIIKEFDGKELIEKEVEVPLINKKVKIYHSNIVKSDFGSGIVMSVPAHAPYDYIGIIEEKLNIQPISIIEVPGFKDFPAKEIVEKMKIKSSNEVEKLEEATQQVYKKEFYSGKMKENVPFVSGLSVKDAREKTVELLKQLNAIDKIYELSEEVICRCKTKCHVKILENQWFISYSNKEWKEKVLNWIEKMNFYPIEAKNNIVNFINQLEDKACARKSGLGAKLPFDEEWIIEPLSDSTIYMAMYTVWHLIGKENLKDEDFDYIFLGIGKARKKVFEKARKEFIYWYPVDLRNSGKDLLQNHLIFYIFNHIAIWDEEKFWPRAISANGYVLVEGEKMSKSKGNIIPLEKLINKYGSDLVRANIVCSAENLDDANWIEKNIENLIKKINHVESLIENLEKAKKEKIGIEEKIVLSKLYEIHEKWEENCEQLRFRSAFENCFYEFLNVISEYLNVCSSIENANKKVLSILLNYFVKMNSIFFPHIMEEFWIKLGNKPFVFSKPIKKPKAKYEKILKQYNFVKNVIEDINKILKIVGKKEKCYIYAFDKEDKKILESFVQLIKIKTTIKEIKVFEKNEKNVYDPLNKKEKTIKQKPAIYLE